MNHRTRLSTISCIIRDSRGNVLREDYKKIGDTPILLTECEAVRQALIMARKMSIPKALIRCDAKVVVNAINGRTSVHKKIITIVEDIKILFSMSRNYSVKYCNRVIDRDADILSKRACI